MDPSRHPSVQPPSTPRWVWISALVVGALIVLAVLVMLLAGGEHGPGMHGAAGASMSLTAEPAA